MTTDVETSAETESAVSTPPSDGVLEQASTEEIVPDVQGEETPGTGEVEAEARSAESYNRQELDALYKEGKLTDPSLVSRRDALIQSDNDRQARERENIARHQAEENARAQQIAQAGAQVRTALTNAYQTEIQRAAETGRDPDFELIKERQERILATYEQVTGTVHLEPHRKGVREALLRVNGDTVQNRQAYSQMDLPDLMVELYNSAYNKGRQSGPDDDHVVMKKADFEKAKSEHAKNELDKALKARGLGAASSTAGTKNGGSSSEYTLAEIDAMPMTQWLALGDDATRKKLLDNARARAR